jgi:molecular chaperone Hsp33
VVIRVDRVSQAQEVDRALGFVVPDRDARGRLVRLGPAMTAVLANHDYPPSIAALVTEALLLAALLGSLLKGEGSQLTLQAQTEQGVVSLLVADYLDGALRGYAQFDADRLAEMPVQPSLFALFGKGYLAITFDQAATKERYQGIVPLEGASLAEAVELYFVQSEQVPSLIRTAIAADGRVAGALLLQHLPEGEDGRERLHVRLDHPEWDHVRSRGETVDVRELADPDLPLESLVWRLFHDDGDIRVLGGAALTKGCRCDAAYIRSVITRFPESERAEMADEKGVISVDCAFCAQAFPMPLSELTG